MAELPPAYQFSSSGSGIAPIGSFKSKLLLTMIIIYLIWTIECPKSSAPSTAYWMAYPMPGRRRIGIETGRQSSKRSWKRLLTDQSQFQRCCDHDAQREYSTGTPKTRTTSETHWICHGPQKTWWFCIMKLIVTRWWFQICLEFSSLPWEMIQFDEHIFQMGWNHHLISVDASENVGRRLVYSPRNFDLLFTRSWLLGRRFMNLLDCFLGTRFPIEKWMNTSYVKVIAEVNIIQGMGGEWNFSGVSDIM